MNDEIARCNPSQYCTERMTCARNQCPPSNARSLRIVNIDASVAWKEGEPCPMHMPLTIGQALRQHYVDAGAIHE